MLVRSNNMPPQIDGEDREIGIKVAGFKVPYVISDADSYTVNITEYLNGVLLRAYTANLGEENEVTITNEMFLNLDQGLHTIRIEANDREEITIRTYTFRITNNAPVISGQDEHLGDKPAPFSVTYNVIDEDKDFVLIKEFIDSKLIKIYTLDPNEEKDEEDEEQEKQIIFDVSNEEFYELSLGFHTLRIEASDGKRTPTIRTYTFNKTGSAPVISGIDKNLKGKTSAFFIPYTLFDNEAGILRVTEDIDSDVLRTFNTTSGSKNILEISNATLRNLSLGTHTITITVTDDTGLSSIRKYTFQKVESQLMLRYADSRETPSIVSRIFVVPLWEVSPGTNIEIKACNNGFDKEQAWEDITNEVLNRKYYTFINRKKTADKAGINISIYMDNGTASSIAVIKKIAVLYE